MKYSRALLKVPGAFACKMPNWICSCLALLLAVFLAAVAGPAKANAAGETGTLYAVSPLRQQVQLSQPTTSLPGGRGFMAPQIVVARDSSGKPLAGIPVTFEVTDKDPMIALMRPYNDKIITATTDAAGNASAANTNTGYVGEGYQVYTPVEGATATLVVKASAPGFNTITFTVEVGAVGATLIDTTPPYITASAKTDTGSVYGAGTWTNHPITVHFTAKDSLSAMKSCSPDQVFQNEGENQSATGTAVDSGNNSASITFGPINIDKTAPTTTATLLDAVYGGWNKTTASIRFDTSDNLSGIDSIYYSVGGGAPFKVPGSSYTLLVNTAGETTVNYWSVDKAGNTEAAKSVTVKVDNAAPSVTGSLSPNRNANGWNNTSVTVTLNGTDAHSGVKEIHYKIGTGIEQIISGSTTSFTINTEGTTTVTFWAVDTVGYVGTTNTLDMKIDRTPPAITPPANKSAEATALNTPVSIGTATVTDVPGYTLTNDAPPAGFPIGATRVTWTATDPAGNASSAVQIVTITDTTPPLMTVPGDIVVEATGTKTHVTLNNPLATDIFPVYFTNDAPADSNFPLGKTLVKWTATDANGNSVSGTQNVIVSDNTKPALVLPPDVTKEATARRTPVDIGMATATDLFGATVTYTAPADFPVGTTDVVWKATDGNGNVTLGTQKITITDTTVPVLTVPHDISVEATERNMKPNIGQATGTDIFNVTVTNDAPAYYPVGTTQVTWKATDENGNSATKVQNVTITDTTKPVLTIPGDKTFEATAVRSTPAIGTATATDIFPVDITNNAPANYPLGETDVLWTATDANKNSVQATQKITIVDTTKPVFTTVPADKTVEATGLMTPVAIGTAAATDIFTATVTNDAPADFPIGTTVVTWTARDPNGNVSTVIQNITVVDTTPPVLTIPTDITKEATAVKTPVDIGKGTATDIFSVTVTNDAPENFSIGTTLVTWTATDANKNTATKVQKITIIDTTRPVFTIMPPDKTVEATAVRTTVDLGHATATDIFAVTITNDAPADFPIGTTPVTWTATDLYNNSITKVQNITIVDTTSPVFTSVPLDMTVEATAKRTPVTIGQATATDIFPVTVTNDAPADFPMGTTTVTWTATDSNGRVATAAQKITIKDTTSPVFTSVPENKTVEATAVRTPVAIGQAAATDIFDVTVTSDKPADYPIGPTTVTWKATDANTNASTATQVITITDTTAPVLTVPADITAEATAVKTPVAIGQATATDIFPVTVTSNAPAEFPIGTTTVTWTARDQNGNITTGVQKVTIIDTTPPKFVTTPPLTITKEATAVRTPVDIGLPTTSDIFPVTLTSDAPAAFPLGTTTVTWTATDANGKVSKLVQTIVIVDTTKPVISVPADLTLEATAVKTPVTIGQATATDIFDVTVTSDAPADYPLGLTKVTWKATDTSGNFITGVQNITVVDTTAPVLTVPADITTEATAVKTPVVIGQATATDIFAVTVTSDAPGTYPIGTTTVTWKATDASGNFTTKEQKVTIIDTTKPVITVPADKTFEATAVLTPVDIGQATATDIFPVTFTKDAPAAFPIGTTLVTWTATDANGQAATGVQKITIVDTTRPVFTIVPPDKTVEATAVRTPVDLGHATATDIFAVTVTNNAPADFSLGTTPVTWTATDVNNNSITKVQNITIVDTTKPVITVPVDLTVEATAVKTPVAIGQATATDIFDVTVISDAPADYPLGTTKVTWKATDTSGNFITGVQNITVVDTTKPVLTVPADITKEATAVNTPVAIGQATATDIFAVTVTSDAPAAYPIGTTTVTWKATDASGNFTTKEQKITITDTTKPVLTVPADKTVEATAVNTPVDIGQATATDIFPVTVTKDAPAAYPIGTTPVTWTATDANGQVSTGVQKITIVDTTRPVLTVPEDKTVEATAVLTPVDIGQATATDIFPVTVTSDAPAVFPIGVTTVTWTATDANGQVTTGVQKITIVDTTAPVLTVPEDKTVEATAVLTPVDIGQATATDIFPVTIIKDAPAVFPIGVTTVTWKATDSNGRTATAIQKITIRDTTAPVFTSIPEAMTVEATAVGTPVTIGQAKATDIFPVTITNDAPAVFSIGVTTVTWKATDANGNIATAKQKITIIDTTKPVFTLVPADMTVEATAVETPVTIGQATATDIFPVTVTKDAPAVFPIGTTIVTWKATDANGNFATATQKITIVDTTKPVFTLVPVDMTVEATAVGTPVAIGEAKATDIFPVTITNDAPAVFPIGVTTVTWKATDVNGNFATAAQKITIIDTTAPKFTVKPPLHITKEATAVRTPVDIGQAEATDIFPVTVTNDAPADYPLGATTVTWKATDANGNYSILVQTIEIVDTTKPVLTVPGDKTVEATAVRTPVDIGKATATDIFPVTITNDAPADFPIGITIVTWKATDTSGNFTTATQKITIVDTTKPVFTFVPTDITKEATAIRTPVNIGNAAATDIFPLTITNDAPVDFPIGTTTVTWTATDSNGNFATATQKITIVDTTKPVLTVPAGITKEATAIRTPVDIGQATATDIFPLTITNDAPENYPLGTTIVTWKATDENGNFATATQEITIIDTTKPKIISAPPAAITAEAEGVKTHVPIGELVAEDIFQVVIENDAPTDQVSIAIYPPVPTSVALLPLGRTDITWTVTDTSGNAVRFMQTVNVVDTTPPVLTVPADMTVEATAVKTPVDIGKATATDIFPVNITNDGPGVYPIGTTIVTWKAIDANGNVTIKTQKITIIDTTKPVFTLVPADMTVEATAINTPVNIGQATATDIFPVTVTNDAPAVYPLGTTTVTWTATDANGNVSTATQKITIVDTTKPVLTIPANKTKEATAIQTPVDIGQATATDIFPVTITNDAPADYPYGTTTVTWTATDANGNVSTAVQEITITDTTRPELTLPEDKTVEATAIKTPVNIGEATATDIFNVVIANDAPADYPIGLTTVTWMAMDEHQNESTGKQKITIVDTTKPVFTFVPADMTVEATDVKTPVDIGQAAATDIFPVTITNDAPTVFPLGTTIVTWKATDANNNVSTAIQNITIVDKTKPVLTVPADIKTEATAINTPVNIGQATATDIFLPVTITSDALAAYPLGTTTVTWTATDANKNAKTGVQSITVEDTTKPVLTVPADITIEATAVRTPVDIGKATATDIFPVSVTNDAQADYPLGTTIVTWTATDANGNVTTKTQKITVVDTTPPRVVSFPRLTITSFEANAVASVIAPPVEEPVFEDIFPVTVVKNGPASWTATDTSGNSTTVTNDAPATYPIGTTKVTWKAVDSKGNILTAIQSITIVDTTKPVFTVFPADKTVEATAIRTPVNIGTATATDIFPVTITNDAPVDFPIGTTTVTWKATDANGNFITKTQKITIVDTTPPVFTVFPADKTVEATAVRTPVDIGIATATDIFPVTITNDAPADYPLGTTTVTWKATDANGNVTTRTQKIVIIDTTKPVLTKPADKTVEATAVRTVAAIGNATATDIFPVTTTNNGLTDYPIGTTKVTWTATDTSGNTSTDTQNITVADTTKPVLTIPANKTVYATGTRTVVSIGSATATDIFPVTITSNAPADYPVGTTQVTWTATDANGNVSTAVQTITVLQKVRLQAYNVTRSSYSNTIDPRIKLTNTAGNPINLSDIKIRYYYTVDVEKAQNAWCDSSTLINPDKTYTITSSTAVSVKKGTVRPGSDYYIEISFSSTAGTLKVGGSVQINTRLARTDWTNYTQSNDYSFNSTATTYTDTTKVTVYLGGTLISGTEP